MIGKIPNLQTHNIYKSKSTSGSSTGSNPNTNHNSDPNSLIKASRRGHSRGHVLFPYVSDTTSGKRTYFCLLKYVHLLPSGVWYTFYTVTNPLSTKHQLGLGSWVFDPIDLVALCICTIRIQNHDEERGVFCHHLQQAAESRTIVDLAHVRDKPDLT